ncbi:helix-turn-helix transcriptional regulator [Patulibacter sp. NPDC049589]|uniref:helix-turn-helix transcriptional regulator n=1 Tax=Patulibacter sp. NPDC049589 TaxID=3154731 RepID=UPI00344434C8
MRPDRYGAESPAPRDGAAPRDLLRRIDLAEQALADLIGGPPGPLAVTAPGTPGPAERVSELLGTCAERLRQTDGADAGPEIALGPVIAELVDLGYAIADADLRRQERMLAACTAALAELRETSSSTALVDAVCAVVARRLGYRHVSLVACDGDDPVTLASHDAPAARQGRAGRRAGAPSRPPGAAGLPSRREVIARVRGHGADLGSIVAVLHPERDASVQIDRDVLTQFADGFGRIYAQAVLRERLAEQRDLLRSVCSTVQDAAAGLDEPIADLHAGAGDGTTKDVRERARTAAARARMARLTDRQAEIMELIAAGATNAEVARRCAIHEDSAKRHLAQILRRLGATNRLEAIAMHYEANDR